MKHKQRIKTSTPNVGFKIIELQDWSMLSLKRRIEDVKKEFKNDELKIKVKHKLGWYIASIYKIKK